MNVHVAFHVWMYGPVLLLLQRCSPVCRYVPFGCNLWTVWSLTLFFAQCECSLELLKLIYHAILRSAGQS